MTPECEIIDNVIIWKALRFTGPIEGNPQITDGLPTQSASNMEHRYVLSTSLIMLFLISPCYLSDKNAFFNLKGFMCNYVYYRLANRKGPMCYPLLLSKMHWLWSFNLIRCDYFRYQKHVPKSTATPLATLFALHANMWWVYNLTI